MYRCKNSVNNENSVKPLKGLLKVAPRRMALLAMVTIVAGAMLLSIATAETTTLSGNMQTKIVITVPTTIDKWELEPDGDPNSVSGALKVEANKKWQVAVKDEEEETKGHMTEWKEGGGYGSMQLTNIMTVDAGLEEVKLPDGGKIQDGAKPGGDYNVEFNVVGDFNDPPLDDPAVYRIVVTFTGSLI